MTDLERFLALYESCGVKCEINSEPDWTYVVVLENDNASYAIEFDSKGKFKTHLADSKIYSS